MINNYYNKSSYTPTFTSRNRNVRIADDVCRKVNKEFLVFSNTRLNQFESCNSDIRLLRYKEALGDIINMFRFYYCQESFPQQIFKMLDGMKLLKAGNCEEFANATYLALKMNGYNNASVLYLYSYNPKTKNIVDLDHVVTALNFKLPSGYKFIDPEKAPKLKNLLKLNNESLILDAWAGFADSGAGAIRKYKTNIVLPEKVGSDDKILALPLKRPKLDEEEVEFLKYKYPGLLLHKSECHLDVDDIKYFESISSFEDCAENYVENVQAIKQSRMLKSTDTNYAMQRFALEICQKDFGFRVFRAIMNFIQRFRH